ncbi:MAG: glycine cleavage system protein GcvH [Caldisericia bacterium]|nr:glycine cleavage system protein GcvH [Caldisericia bacterium]
MSDIRIDVLYTKNDEWVKVENDIATIGITDYAQSHLGDIVFVEPCEEGQEIKKNDVLTTVESVKSAADIYSPISGVVTEFNASIDEEADIMNKEPFDGGWICKMKITNPDDLKDLLSPDQYRAAKVD